MPLTCTRVTLVESQTTVNHAKQVRKTNGLQRAAAEKGRQILERRIEVGRRVSWRGKKTRRPQLAPCRTNSRNCNPRAACTDGTSGVICVSVNRNKSPPHFHDTSGYVVRTSRRQRLAENKTKKKNSNVRQTVHKDEDESRNDQTCLPN